MHFNIEFKIKFLVSIINSVCKDIIIIIIIYSTNYIFKQAMHANASNVDKTKRTRPIFSNPFEKLKIIYFANFISFKSCYIITNQKYHANRQAVARSN